ncbi:hypothetical protein D3C84_1270650 [compost metagenome]
MLRQIGLEPGTNEREQHLLEPLLFPVRNAQHERQMRPELPMATDIAMRNSVFAAKLLQ